MKKRITAIALTLALAATMTFPVSAADSYTTIDEKSDVQSASTQLNFQVNPTYSVTIPAEVKLSENVFYDYYAQQDDIIAKDVKLPEGATLNVTLESDYKLEVEGADDYALPYIVQASEINDTASGRYPNNVTAQNNLAAAFVSSADEQKVRLNFQTEDAPKYAGTYTDTVTFNIAIQQSYFIDRKE